MVQLLSNISSKIVQRIQLNWCCWDHWKCSISKGLCISTLTIACGRVVLVFAWVNKMDYLKYFFGPPIGPNCMKYSILNHCQFLIIYDVIRIIHFIFYTIPTHKINYILNIVKVIDVNTCKYYNTNDQKIKCSRYYEPNNF